MLDIKPQPFGRCAETRCPGRCPYRDPELRTAGGRAALLDGVRPAEGEPWPAKVVHVLCQGTASVACGDTLLTPDTPLYPGQHVLVRTVMSSG